MVFKHVKEGRSQRPFLSPLLTTTDKQPLVAQLGDLHPVSAQGWGGAPVPASRTPVIGCEAHQKPSGGPAAVGTDASLPKRNNGQVIKERWIFPSPSLWVLDTRTPANDPGGGNSHNRASQEDRATWEAPGPVRYELALSFPSSSKAHTNCSPYTHLSSVSFLSPVS